MALLTILDSDWPSAYAQYCNHVWHDGTFLYVGTGGRGTFVYSVAGNGVLTKKSNFDDYSPVRTPAGYWGDGTYLYVATDDGFRSYSISALGVATFISSHSPADDPRDVWGDDTYLYTVNANSGINKYSTSSGILTHVAQYAPEGNSESHIGIFGYGDYLYCAGSYWNDTWALRTYSKTLAIVSSVLPTADGAGRGVWGDANYVYVKVQSSVEGHELYCYSVSVAGSLSKISSVTVTGGSGIWGQDGYVYLADAAGGLKIYSTISGNLVLVETYLAGTTIYGVFGDTDFIYVAAADAVYVYSAPVVTTKPRINYFNRIQPFILN